ncbi:MAG: right-handed parallel beta-helix repeat-containing protein [bacterium]
MSRLRRSLRILPFLVLAFPVVCGGSVRRVPSQYATINAAIDAAAPGDSVVVAPGVYDQYDTRLLADGYWYSAVAFLKSGVSVISEAGAGATMMRLDSAPEAPRLCKGFGLPGTVEVAGFTMTGTAPHIEGAVFANGGRLVLRDCVFQDLGVGFSDEVASGTVMSDMEVHGCRFENINGATGSAINQTSGTLLVEDSEFISCRSGAVALRYDSGFPHPTGMTVRRCRFVNNVQTLGGSAAIFVRNYTSVLIEESWFEGNQSIYTGGGGAMGGALSTSASSMHLIRDNTFVRNTADYAGAVAVWGSGAQVLGNTFWGNWTRLNSSQGGASVYFDSGGVLTNNVIAGSTGDEAVGRLGGVVQTSCNVFWANPVGNATFPLSSADLVVDPQFCDAAGGDFTVNAASPCLPGHGDPSCMDLIGAWGQGCGTVSVEPSTWGKVKSEFRSESGVAR